jgi:hypothetical protein
MYRKPKNDRINKRMDYKKLNIMKPKYVFYLLLLVMMHYEVGRLINSGSPDMQDSATAYKHSAKLYNNDTAVQFNTEHRLHLVKLNGTPPKPHHSKLFKAL